MASGTGNVVMTPGVYFTETDISQYAVAVNDTILGLVGTASRGPTDTPMLLTSITNMQNIFGEAYEAYPGLIAAREFFNAGGGQCWFVRVAETPTPATASVSGIDGTSELAVDSLDDGSYYNDLTLVVSYGNTLQQTDSPVAQSLTSGSPIYTTTLTKLPVVPKTVAIKFQSDSSADATDDGNGNLVFPASGSYSAYTGTVNYNTGAVSINSHTGSSLSLLASFTYGYYSNFVLQVKYQSTDVNGNPIGPYVMETWPSLTITNMTTMIATSNYIAISANPTHFPLAGSYPMSGGADGTAEIADINYIGNTIAGPTGLQNFASPDAIDVNLLAIPGVSSDPAIENALSLLTSTSRQDCMAIIDPPQNADTPQTAVNWITAGTGYASNPVIDNNRMMAYFPWYTIENPDNGNDDLVPPSVAGVAACAASALWQAPAGPLTGQVNGVIELMYNSSVFDRQYLYDNNINPIGRLANLPISVLGQKTATLEASSLDRIGARRFLLMLEKALTTACYPFLFFPNIQSTWDRVLQVAQPLIDANVSLGYLYAGKVYCDSTTNTPALVNNNQMAIQVNLQLLKFAEIITLNFVLQTYGSTISENVTNNAQAA